MAIQDISIKDFINSESNIGIGYKDYWKESNIDKNVFLPHEQLMTIERRIIWSAHRIGMGGNINEDHKTPELSGEVIKYHISGETSIQDSIKGLATNYKRQQACRILKGVGNMGSHAGDPGAAARYTHVRGTPLLKAISRDIKYVPLFEDETGLEQPEYISTPIPMALINGLSNIGTGHSAYYDERDAREVIDWIENMVDGNDTQLPDPISSTGCNVYKHKDHTFYEAAIHKEGHYDIITKLPPKTSPGTVIAKLEEKLPKKAANKVQDASEEGKPIWIEVPKGHLDRKDYNKYSLKKARQEKPYIWDEKLDTMKMSSHSEVAMRWYEERKNIIEKRIESEISDINKDIHRINLIVKYYEDEMNKMKEKEIIDILGEDDAETVLSQPAKVFLGENIEKSKKRKNKLLDQIKELQGKDAKNELFKEARNIIEEQEKYFSQFEV